MAHPANPPVETFRHFFGGWDEQDAIFHINPDGSKGGIVAASATIGENVVIAPSAEVFPRARIGACARIGARTHIGDGTRIGDGTYIGYDARIGDGVCIGYGTYIGDGTYIGYDARIGDGVCIGARAYISGDAHIEKDDWWTTYGPIGSRNVSFTAVQTTEGLRFWVGCEHNVTAERLREMVAETHAGTDHEADCLHAIDSIERNPARLRCEAARVGLLT